MSGNFKSAGAYKSAKPSLIIYKVVRCQLDENGNEASNQPPEERYEIWDSRGNFIKFFLTIEEAYEYTDHPTDTI
jgi:hypothetical protein